MGLVIRTIKLARAKVKIGPANLTYNMKRTLADNAADGGINKPHDRPQPNRTAHAIKSQREEALNQPNPRACTSTNHHHPAKTRFLEVGSLGGLRAKMLGAHLWRRPPWTLRRS
jgi:hypothetical protein